jgi:hypothetical protein
VENFLKMMRAPCDAGRGLFMPVCDRRDKVVIGNDLENKDFPAF